MFSIFNVVFLFPLCNSCQIIWTSAQSIRNSSLHSWSVSNIQIVHLKLIDPPRESCRRSFNCVHVFQGLVVCVDCDTMTVVKISMPPKQRLLDGEQFLLMDRIPCLSIAELSALICDRMKLAILCLLQKATSNCKI